MTNKFIFLIAFISSCSTESIRNIEDTAPGRIPVDILAIPDAIPKDEKRTRAGNPVHYKVLGKTYTVLKNSTGYQETGLASWYGTKFHGNKTSNGEIYDMYAMTAAHKTLPIPSYVRVINLKNNRTIVVRINDRGPFHGNRIIDLSYTAAVKLDIEKTGTEIVKVIALEANGQQKRQITHPTIPQNSISFLQVGAFVDRHNATKLLQRLQSTGINNSKIKVSQTQNNIIYRVQVGPLFSDQHAKNINEKLINLGHENNQLITQQ